MATIRKHEGPRGVTWRVRQELPPVGGKRRWKWVIAATKKEVERITNEMKADMGKGQYTEYSREKLAAYLDRWLAMKAGDLRGSSHRRAAQDIARQIAPALGHLPLVEIRPSHIQKFYADKQKTHAASSIVRMHAVLNAALKMAFEQEMIPRNPCALARPPRVTVGEPTVWTATEAKLFLAACDHHPWGAYFRLLLFTGLRRGEALALRWADLDLAAGTLTVRRTLSINREGQAVLNPPKSAAGRRTVVLTPSCLAALTKHRAAQNEARLAAFAWHDLDYVFAQPDGRLWSVTKPNVELKRIAEECGVPPLRVHDLRHTSATLALGQGVDARLVQMRLGHSSIAMTRRYQHPSTQMQEEAAERMEKALG